MSTNVGAIHYDLTLNTDAFDKAAASLNGKVNSVSDKLQSIGKGMTDVGKKMTVGLTLPIVAGAGFAIKSASDLNETMNKVNVAFGTSAKSVMAFGDTSLKSLGLAKGSALDAAALFGDMATSMGLSQSEAANMSIKMVQLGGDLASFKNIGFEQAQTALAGIFTGETESLKKLGIVMTETNLQEFARTQGITKNIAELSQAEKVNLRYAFVMAKTTNAQGDFAKTADGTANQMRMTSERVKEMSAQLGEKLLPAWGRLLEIGNKVLDWFGGLSTKGQNVAIVIAGIAAAIGPLLIFFGNIVTAVGKLLPVFKAVFAAISGLSAPVLIAIIAIAAAAYLIWRNWDKVRPVLESVWNIFKLLISGDFTGGIFGLPEDNGIIIFLINMHKVLKSIADFVMTQFKSALDSLKRIWEQLVTAMQPLIDLFKEFWQQHGKQVMEILKVIAIVIGAIMLGPLVALFAVFLAALKIGVVILKFIADHFDLIKKVIIALLAVAFAPMIASVLLVIGTFLILKAAIGLLANFFVTAWQSIYSSVSGAINAIKNTIVLVWQTIWAFIQPILNFILNLFIIVWGSIFLVVINAVKLIYNTIVSIWQAVWGFIQPILTMILNFYIGVFTSIYNTVWGAIQAIWNVIVSVWNAIYGFIAPIVSAIWNTIVGAFNSVWATLSGIFNGILNVARSVWNTIYGAISGAINNVTNFFAGAGKWLYDAGKNIIQGLVNGIGDMAGAVFRKAQEVADGVKNKIKGALGIKSPSRVMMGVGVNVGEGLTLGMKKALPNIRDMALNMANNVQSPMSNFAPQQSAPNATTNNNIYGNITLGDTAAVNTFFNRLDRNGELARKGMATI